MKRFFSITLVLFATAICMAQINGNGYYRVKNNKSTRYIYIYDGTSAGIDVATTSADMGAVQLWKNHPLLTDPASVIYAEKVGDKWNLNAQGTGVHQLIGHYVAVTGSDANNAYQVAAEEKDMTLYLYDGNTGNGDRSALSTGSANGSIPAAYRVWNVHPMNQTDNYIAIQPNVQVGDKFFAPYYVSFPFSFYDKGMKAYYIKKIDTNINAAVLAEVTGVVPSSTPVIVECSSQDAANNKLQLENYKGYNNTPADNVLSGVYFANKYRESPVAYKEYSSATMRVLGVTVEGKLGFITATESMLTNCGDSSGKIWCINANTAYLSVPAGTAAELTVMTEEEYEKHLPVAVASISIDQAAVELHKGETAQLTVTVLPENATNQAVEWSSSDEKVATVDADGVVKAKALGTATIKATTLDGTNLSATSTITVVPVLVESIVLSDTEIELVDGESKQIRATVLPENAEKKSVNWTSADVSIATVNMFGIVQMVAEGVTTITVTATDGSEVSASCQVTCKKVDDGIDEIIANDANATFFGIDGRRYPEAQKGLNIVRTSNGKVMKITK